MRPRIVLIGKGHAYDSKLIVGQRIVAVVRDAQLRLRLFERAFGAVEGKLQLARLDADQDLSPLNRLPQLDADLAHHAGHFAADVRLIG